MSVVTAVAADTGASQCRPMSLQNRVDPFSRLLAVPARGTLTGNRGCLHDDQRRIRPGQTWRSRRWISCRLDWKGVRRTVMAPNRWTELFFLDEATALAAGHRPCAYCRREAFEQFRTALIAGNPGRMSAAPGADGIDRLIHGDRLTPEGRQRRHPALASALPPGALFEAEGLAWLRTVSGARAWAPDGYGPTMALPASEVAVLTPLCLVEALRAGYGPAGLGTANATVASDGGSGGDDGDGGLPAAGRGQGGPAR